MDLQKDFENLIQKMMDTSYYADDFEDFDEMYNKVISGIEKLSKK